MMGDYSEIKSIKYEPREVGSCMVDTHKQSLDEINAKIDKLHAIKNPVMYVFVNKGLDMDAGKVAAQVAHAQEELFTEIMSRSDSSIRKFHLSCMKQNPRTVIILEAKDTDELYKINAYLESCDITTGIYVDEGSADGDYMLEPTALACQYLDKADARTETIFKMFRLYTCEHQTETVKKLNVALQDAFCLDTKLSNINYIMNSETFSKRKKLKYIQEQLDSYVGREG